MDGVTSIVAPSPQPGRRRPWWRQLRTGDWAVDLACLSIALMGFNRWRVGEYPLSDFVFVAAAAVIVVRLLTGHSRMLAPAESRRSSTLILCGALVVLTAGTLSSLGAWNPLGSIGVVLRLSWLTLIWFWILRSVTTSREVFNRLLRAWRFALLLGAGIAATSELGLTNFTVANNEGRQTAFFGHPNDLAGFLVAGLPLIVLGVPPSGTRSASSTWWRLAALGLMGYALSTTGSMSAVVGAVVGIVAAFAVLIVTRDPRRARRRHPLFVMTMIVVTGVALVLLSASDLPLFSRIDDFGAGGSGVNTSVEQRGVRNQLVMDRLDELLVVGIGLDHESLGKIAAQPESAADPDALGVHNMYLKVLLEAGLFALIGLWLIIGTVLRQAWRLMYNLRDDPLHPTLCALFGCVVTVNVFAMFQPTLYHRYYWLPIALITVLWALRRQELREGLGQLMAAPAVDDLPRRPSVA